MSYMCDVAIDWVPSFYDIMVVHRRALPWLPCTSIFMNVFLIGNLPYKSFIRFGVLIVVGLVVYFLYGPQPTSYCIFRMADLCASQFSTY